MNRPDQMPADLEAEREAHQRKLVIRLRRVEGQLRGIQAMMEKGDSCERIAQQLSAARRALDKTFHEMVACSVKMDIAGSRSAAEVDAATERMARLLDRFG